jgi:hypothetical protein
VDPPGRAPARARIATHSSHLKRKEVSRRFHSIGATWGKRIEAVESCSSDMRSAAKCFPRWWPHTAQRPPAPESCPRGWAPDNSWTCARPGSAPLAGSRIEYPLRKGRSPRAGNCRCERPRGLAASDPHSCRAASGLVEVKLRCRRPKQGRVHTVRVAAIDEVLQDGVDFDRRTAL